MSSRRVATLPGNADAKPQPQTWSSHHSRSNFSSRLRNLWSRQQGPAPDGALHKHGLRARLGARAQADGPRLEPIQLVQRAADGHVGDEVVDIVLVRGRARLLRHDRLRRREAVVRAPDGLAVADRQACRADTAASNPDGTLTKAVVRTQMASVLPIARPALQTRLPQSALRVNS